MTVSHGRARLAAPKMEDKRIMTTVHDIKIVGLSADGTVTLEARGNLTIHDEPVTEPPEVQQPGEPVQPIAPPPPPAPTPHKK
jgi:outer membrane biosynthesis protein TonB